MIKIAQLIKPGRKTYSKNFAMPEQRKGVTNIQLAAALADNLNLLKEALKGGGDIVFREFKIGFDRKQRAMIVYASGLANVTAISDAILNPLRKESGQADKGAVEGVDFIDFIKDYVLTSSQVGVSPTVEDIVNAIITGDTALLIDGTPKALLINTKGWEARGVEEPETEAVVRGPREGFTERISVNTALLRRKIKDDQLFLESMTIGRRSRTTIYIAYIKGVANEKLVAEVKHRLQRINIDAILESGYIEQLVEDAPRTIFPTVGNTEKPDILAAKLLEGRVGIFVDGTPFVLTMPYLFVEAFQNAEDYYSRPYFATVIRIIRIIAFLISSLLPAVYIGVESFNKELIPTALLITMANSREGVPFPPYVEVITMGLIFEIMREAGVRMPRPIGQAVSIVGALVIGESAVKAGLVSSPMVIVVALTAIAGFVVPSLGDAIPIMRIGFSLCALVLGLFGVLMAAIGLLIHLCKLRSFGIPYLMPLAPGHIGNLGDVFARRPLWAQQERSDLLGDENPVRSDTPPPSPNK